MLRRFLNKWNFAMAKLHNPVQPKVMELVLVVVVIFFVSFAIDMNKLRGVIVFLSILFIILVLKGYQKLFTKISYSDWPGISKMLVLAHQLRKPGVVHSEKFE